MLSYFPQYFSTRAIGIYFLILATVFLLFMGQFMSWIWLCFGVVEVLLFFLCSNKWSREWEHTSEKRFVKLLWQWGLGLRIGYVLFSYLFYQEMTGIPFEFGSADSSFYQIAAGYGASLLSDGHWGLYPLLDKYSGGLQLSDSGYPIYLSFIYWITGDSILIARLIKAILSTWMVVLMYRIGQRHFEESTARMAAIFCLVMPNLIFYTGLHLKETEMVFLTVAFVERTDALLLGKKYNFKTIVLPLVLMVLLFFFRTVLGACAVMAFLTTLFFSDSQRVSWAKRLLVALWVGLVALYFVGGNIMLEVQQTWEARGDNQSTSMAWRAERQGGNAFAKYASASVFAPLIFTIPFPTIVDTPGQENMKMIHGGNYVKNITSFFTIWALFLLFFRQRSWRKHLLPLSMMLFYLAVIALSAFAQSERFHLPALPFALLFAAYGVSQMRNKDKVWFNLWLLFIFLANIGWSWFKLAGRGMV